MATNYDELDALILPMTTSSAKGSASPIENTTTNNVGGF